MFEHHGANCPADCIQACSIEDLKEIYEKEDHQKFYEDLAKLRIDQSRDGPYDSTIYRRK